MICCSSCRPGRRDGHTSRARLCASCSVCWRYCLGTRNSPEYRRNPQAGIASLRPGTADTVCFSVGSLQFLEFVASNSRNHASRTDHFLDLGPERNQGLISNAMPVDIVDQFQPIHVDDQNAGLPESQNT